VKVARRKLIGPTVHNGNTVAIFTLSARTRHILWLHP